MEIANEKREGRKEDRGRRKERGRKENERKNEKERKENEKRSNKRKRLSENEKNRKKKRSERRRGTRMVTMITTMTMIEDMNGSGTPDEDSVAIIANASAAIVIETDTVIITTIDKSSRRART